MKKSVKSLLIMLAVLVVLGGAAAALVLLPSGEEDESSPVSSAERESLVEIAKEDISSIQVENSNGGFTILPAGGGGEDEEAMYTVSGLEQYDLDDTTLETCVEDVSSIRAIKSLGEQEDLEKYGLSGERAVKVTIKEQSGGETELVLGDTSESGTAGQYILLKNQVYIVTALPEALREGPLNRVSCVVYTVADSVMVAPDENGEDKETTLPDTLFSLELTGAAFEEPITVEYVEKSRLNGYMLTSPVTAESGTEKFDTMLTALKSLTANSVEAVGVKDSELEKYGLTEPDAKAVFRLNESDTITVKLSKKDSENMRYVMLEGRDVVYKVDNSRVKAWAEVKPMDLRQSLICLANIADVAGLRLTAEGDMVYDFTIDLEAEEKTVKKPGGGEIAYEDYQSFFKQLISLSVFSLEEAPCEGTPALTVEYRYKDGTENVLAFYPVEGQDRYACTLDGGFNGQVRGSEMAPLLQALKELYGA